MEQEDVDKKEKKDKKLEEEDVEGQQEDEGRNMNIRPHIFTISSNAVALYSKPR